MSGPDVNERLKAMGVEGWRNALMGKPQPPLSRRRKLTLALKDLRWRLSQWLDPYY